MPDSVSVKVETNLAAAMRDGTTLYADVYRPDGPGPFPTILQRTPYDKSASLASQMLDPIKAAKAGFALIIQDTRGRFTSGGEFYCFTDDINDGYDTVEWAASQPWSSGKVGMIGASYVGATQWLAATTRPPHLAAIAPNVTASNYHDGWTYQGGAFELGFNVSWTLLQLTLANFKTHSGIRSIPQARQGDLLKAVDGMTDAFLHLPLKEMPHLKGGAGRLLLRLAGASGLRRLLEEAVHRGAALQHQRAGAEHRRLVRHLPSRHHPQLPGNAEERGHRGGPEGPEAHHRPLAAQLTGHQHGGQPLFRRGRRRPGPGPGRDAPALVPALAQGR